MKNLSASTILNLGSIATFAAFPFLYSASYNNSGGSLAAGLALIVFSMITPFAALKAVPK